MTAVLPHLWYQLLAENPALSRQQFLAERLVSLQLLASLQLQARNQVGARNLAEDPAGSQACNRAEHPAVSRVEDPASSRARNPAGNPAEAPAVSRVGNPAEGPALSRADDPALSRAEDPALSRVRNPALSRQQFLAERLVSLQLLASLLLQARNQAGARNRANNLAEDPAVSRRRPSKPPSSLFCIHDMKSFVLCLL